MPRYKLTVAYDGTGFVGWQRQAEGISIQGLLEDALAILDERPVTIAGAGRTDAGVHALGQVVSVTLAGEFDPPVVVRASNARLPEAVRVVTAERVPDAFHARVHATAKTYRYRIWNGPVMSPFERAYAWHVLGALDVAAMEQAAAMLVGRHDFAAFQGAGSVVQSSEREIFASAISSRGPRHPGEDGVLVTYEVSGSGFLRHMVRTIVGTLAEIGRGKWPPEIMRQILESRSRALAGPTAPPTGLFLVRVFYRTPDL